MKWKEVIDEYNKKLITTNKALQEKTSQLLEHLKREKKQNKLKKTYSYAKTQSIRIA